MDAIRVAYKPPSLKSLETLSEVHRAWLEHYFGDSHSDKITAKAFGVSPQAIRYVRTSPAGQAYALRLIGGDKAALNLHAANLLMQNLESLGTRLPMDLVLKIYLGTLPKDYPQGKTDEMLDFAERLANKMGLEDDERAELLEFVRSGGEAL
jgi:hypothetical protein